MEKNYIGNYKADHSRFGGTIYLGDFETDYRGDNHELSTIAQRIESDMKFDERCRRDARNRDKNGHSCCSWSRKEK